MFVMHYIPWSSWRICKPFGIKRIIFKGSAMFLKCTIFFQFQSELPSKDLFLHTWSLAVEIQFYLVVPFIFLILSIFPKLFYKITLLTWISIISCAYYFYCDPSFSFNFPLCRLWQFTTGMIAFSAYKVDEHTIDLGCKSKLNSLLNKAKFSNRRRWTNERNNW